MMCKIDSWYVLGISNVRHHYVHYHSIRWIGHLIRPDDSTKPKQNALQTVALWQSNQA